MKLGGKEGGVWKTAQAKAYPPKLNYVLAQQHALFAASLEGDGATADPAGLIEALEALANSYDPYLDTGKGTLMRSDYFLRTSP